jgi:hypothetical protein
MVIAILSLNLYLSLSLYLGSRRRTGVLQMLPENLPRAYPFIVPRTVSLCR